MARRLKEVRGGEASKAEAKEKALVASQFKILDNAKPLLYLWGSASAASDPLLISAAESALQLWGHAFHSIPTQRRENVLHQTDPRFEALLAEPGRFKAKDCGLLFGRTFLRGMVRDASDDQKLKSLGQPGSRPPTSSSSRHGRPSSSSRGAKSGRSGSGFTLHGNFNKRGSRPGSSSNRGSRLVASVPLDSSVSLPPTLVGGRVRNFSSFWPSLTADRWVLDAVSVGVRIPFIELPSQIRPGKNMYFSAEMKGSAMQK